MSEREDKLRFVEECSTESLAAVFDPAYASRLNCPLADHVLRSMVGELIRRGQELTPAMRDVLRGPDVCEHGRSTSGTCGECERPVHPRLRGLPKERRREVVCEITNELLKASYLPHQLTVAEGGWECPDPDHPHDPEEDGPAPPPSPTGFCVYPSDDEWCLFCGHPEERK